MKNRFFIVVVLIGLLLGLTGNAWANTQAVQSTLSLVYIHSGSQDDISRFASTGLPLYARLEKGLLSAADPAGEQALQQAGLSYEVLDRELGSGSYYLAQVMPNRKMPDFAQYGSVLLNTGHNSALLRMDASHAQALSLAGAELKAITLTPKPLPQAQAESVFPDVVEPDPMIQQIMDQVTQEDVYQYLRELSGEVPVWVDGGWYTITTRDSMSGVPITKAAHYAGEQMAANGLDVEYHQWSSSHGPNVIGQYTGLTNPEDIFIIGGHLDDVGAGEGADDNASGSVAAMIAADILTQYQWGCTVRFALWTGEEYGLLGSDAYAQRSYQQGENIVGYLNLDMIAWNTIGSSPTIYLGWDPSNPPSLGLAELFSDVVDAYNVDLIPVIGTQYTGSSDHGSFNDFGYPAVLGIEGDDDFNPYYHGPNDTVTHTDPGYFTKYVKASLATFAHMSGCLISSGIGSLDGHVTAEGSGTPIQDVKVTADDGLGHSFSTTTDATGYYTKTLLAGTYTVSTDVYGYYPFTVNNVEIVTDTTTTLDIALTPLPTHTVSGYVREMGTDLPLAATVEFLDSPVAPVNTDPATGFYSIDVAEGTWTMRATAASHAPQTVTVDVTGNTQQDFSLSLFCSVLADDVEGGNIGWTAQTPWAITTELSHSPTHSWTDSPGGDYQNYVNTSLTSPVLNLTNYEDVFLSFWHIYDTEPGYDYAYVEYSTNGGGSWTPAATYNGTNTTWTQQEILLPQLDGQSNTRIRFHFTSDVYIVSDGWHIDDINLIGGGPGCMPTVGTLEGHVTDADTGLPLGGVLVTAAPGKAINAITDPNGYYSMFLPAGEYQVTAALDGYASQTAPATIVAQETTVLNFALESSCEPVSSPDFTWLPVAPRNGEAVTFHATAGGTSPIEFQWDFGDTGSGSGATIDHVFSNAGTYSVTLTATNACGSEPVSKDITILQMIWQFFLSLVNRG